MKKIILIGLFILSVTGSYAQRPIKLQNEADSISYAVGFLTGYSISEKFPGIEKLIVPATFDYAFKATLAGEMPFMDENKAERFVEEYFEVLKKQLWKENREAGERFLETNRSNADVYVTRSGLQYKILHPGSDDNERPREYDDMIISYVGKTISGTVFDEEEDLNTYPANLNDGLNEGTQLMSPGAKYIFYIPYKLAYGENAQGKLPPYSTAVFEVEMASMTRDHSYYDEEEGSAVSLGEDTDESEPISREAGDYIASTLTEAHLNVRINGYDSDEYVSTYETEGFKIILTGDKTIVLDSRDREIFRNTLDEEENSYDQYYLTEFRSKNGTGPVFLVLDMGFSHGSFYGSMVYKIENGTLSQVPEFLNLVTFDRNDSDEHYGRLTPVLDLYQNSGVTLFCFAAQVLSYNPAGIEIFVPGEDFHYRYENGSLTEAGPALNLSYFTNRELIDQFRENHDYRIWHSEKGDVNGDGKADFVIFVYENETIYVCQFDGNKLGKIEEFDLPYDYSIDRSSRVLRNGAITVERDDNDAIKRLTVHNGNLVEKE